MSRFLPPAWANGIFFPASSRPQFPSPSQQRETMTDPSGPITRLNAALKGRYRVEREIGVVVSVEDS